MRLKSKNWVKLFAALSGLMLLAGCGPASQLATYQPQFAPSATARVGVGTVTDSADRAKRSDIPADFVPSAELKSQLEQKLADHQLAGDANAPGAIVLIPTITDYDPGNAAVRWIAPGAGGTVLNVTCVVQQGGVAMGPINIQRAINFGGLYTIGDWKSIFGAVADDIVDQLQKKMQIGA